MKKYEAIRTEIKKLSDQQKSLKANRKNKSLTWEELEAIVGREVKYKDYYKPTGYTVAEINSNKNELRHLFHAYALLKGKKPSVLKDPYKIYKFDQSKIDELVKQYSEEIPV